MKTWHWVNIILIAFVFIIGFIYSSLFFGTYQIDRYEVFRHILTLILSISALSVAALGVAIYKIIYLNFERLMNKKIKEKIEEVDFEVREKVEQEVKAKVDKRIEEVKSEVDKKIEEVDSKAVKRTEYEKDRIFVDLHLELSVIYWKQYEKKWDGYGKILLTKDQESFLALAIQTGEDALKKAKRLDKKDFEKLICGAKNNLAYHLAVRGVNGDFPRILDLAKYVYDKASNFDYRDTWIWVETYAFSLVTIGKATGNDDQVGKGRGLIKGLIKSEEIVNRYKQYIKKKYEKLL